MNKLTVSLLRGSRTVTLRRDGVVIWSHEHWNLGRARRCADQLAAEIGAGLSAEQLSIAADLESGK